MERGTLGVGTGPTPSPIPPIPPKVHPEIPPRTKPLRITIKRAKIPDYYLSMAKSVDRMVTQVPEEEAFPKPSQVEEHFKKVPNCDGTPTVPTAKVTTQSSAKMEDRMVTPVPKKEVVPTPTTSGWYEVKKSKNAERFLRGRTRPTLRSIPIVDQPQGRTGWSPTCLRRERFQCPLNQERTWTELKMRL